MRPTELAKILAITILAGEPVMLKGAPGVGKTDVVKQATAAAKADLVLMHPVVSDPTDYKGIGAIIKDSAEFLPTGELRKLMTAKKKTVAFLDDLGQAPAVVQAAAMQLILSRQINGHAISEHVVFIAATNRREDRAGVTGILEPVKSRFATIIEMTPNNEDWNAWALENGVPPVLVAFNRFRPELMMAPGTPTNDIVNRPSPRTVTNMGRLFKLGIQDIEVLAGSCGSGYATEFLGFVRVWQQLPSMDGIIASPRTATVPTEPAALYAITTTLAGRATAATAGKILEYFVRLPSEFAVLGIRDTLRKYKEAANMRPYIDWITANQNLLM